MPARALVTGGTGYLGRRLMRRLLDAGCEVTLLVGPTSVIEDGAAAAPRADIVRLPSTATGSDIAHAVERALADSEPDVVFSLAVRRDADPPTDIAETVETNVLLPTLLATGVAAAGHGVFVGASSYAAGATERPAALHVATRQALRPILEWAAEAHRLCWTTVAPSSIYGPDDPRPKLLPKLVRALGTGETVHLVHPERRLDLIHVEDTVDAFLAAAAAVTHEPACSGSTFDARSGTLTTLADLVALVERIAGRTLDVRWNERPPRALDAIEPVGIGAPVPGWSARVSLDDGIRQVVDAAQR